MRFKFRCQVVAMLAMLGSASAAADDQFRQPIKSVELIPGWRDSDETGEFHVIGIHLQLQSNWKTYWRAPGSLGLPPRFDWSGRRNLESAETLWPAPRILVEGDSSFPGYEKEVVLPVYLRPESPGEDIAAYLNFEFGVCNEICIATDATLSAKLPARDVIPHPGLVEELNDLHATFRDGHPDEVPRCRFAASEYGHKVTLEYTLPPINLREPHFVLEYLDDRFQFEEAEVHREAENLVATSVMHYRGEGAVLVDRSAIRSTAIFDGEAIEFRGCAGS